jgi:hypothetical protein
MDTIPPLVPLEPQDALDVFLDPRVQLEDEGLPALAVTQVLEHLLPLPVV